jgi:MoaA/NifB/PqqE/SkfB family radical SAM enzyme
MVRTAALTSLPPYRRLSQHLGQNAETLANTQRELDQVRAQLTELRLRREHDEKTLADTRGDLHQARAQLTVPTPAAPAAPPKPIRFVAMDIVDNCNLRCPFCLYDYQNTHKTNLMRDEVFDAAMGLLPYVGPAHFWLSCLHEPTMHPKFAEFIERIPADYRSNVFYTSNLARRMPSSYYATVANSGLAFINISIESREPALYERMRKGARHRIFMESWDELLAAFRHVPAPPKLRYIVMAYKSNLREIPDLAKYLHTERSAAQVEIRYTYDMAHIATEFKQGEFLDAEDWRWLTRQLDRYDPADVSVCVPPEFESMMGAESSLVSEPALQASLSADGAAACTDEPTIAAGEYELRMSYDGTIRASPHFTGKRPEVVPDIIDVNVLNIGNPRAFFDSLKA